LVFLFIFRGMGNYLEQLKSITNLPLILGFLLCVFTVLAFQGFDVCDEGWYLSFYQQIFNNPQSVEYNFAFWLTGIVGGLWYELFPNGGVLSFRLLALLINLATLLISYTILKQFLKKEVALLSLTMIFFINDFALLAFYYNHLSGFLAVIVIWLLISGLKKNQLKLILLAGLITAANVFARLPNILLFSFVLVFPAQFILDKKSTSFKSCLRNVLYYFIGAILGFVIIYILLWFFGHIDIMKNSVLGIIDKGRAEDSNHNIIRLLQVYKAEYAGIVLISLKLIIIFLLYSFFNKYLEKSKFFKFGLQAFTFLMFSYLVYTQNINVLYALGFFGVLGIILNKTLTIHLKLLAFLALIFMVLLPFGSDNGIHNAGYVSLWFSIPLFFWYMHNIKEVKISWHSFNSLNNISISQNVIKQVVIIFVFAFFITKFYKIGNNSYFDRGSRINKVFAINNNLANVYTTEKRANIINDLLAVLHDFVEEDNYLLAYDNIPMVNYLTKTKPYMRNSWVWVYDSFTFERKLKEAEQEIEVLPVVVLQKFETKGNFSEPKNNYLYETKEENYNYKRGRVKALNSFLERNNYIVVWSNDYFDILKANPN